MSKDAFEEKIRAFKAKLEARLSQARSGARVIKTEAVKRSKEQLERLEQLFEDGYESASEEFIKTLHAWLEAEEKESEAEAPSDEDEKPASDETEAELSPEERAKRRQEELEAKKKAIEERLGRAAQHLGGVVVEVAEAARLHFSELEGDVIDGLDVLTKTASQAVEKWRESSRPKGSTGSKGEKEA